MSTRVYTRREVLRTVGSGAVWAALPGTLGAQEPPPRRPNILYIMTDDHAAHALSCYGSRINTTPNLDRLAREGVRFTNCFCTNGICGPSRATILTGQYSHINGQIDNAQVFDGRQVTYPKLLRAAGYETALVGKWHLKSDPTGFDYWNILPGQGIYQDPTMLEMGTSAKQSGYVTDLITDRCIAWLKARTPDRPFLLLCHHKAPHRNWSPDARHAGLYADVDVAEPETFDDDYRTRCDAAREARMTIERHLTANDVKGEPPAGLTGPALKKWNYQRFIKDYLRCVASVDDNVGRLLGYLESSGLAANTLVVYTSDQGFFLGDHGWYDKRFMYEEALRMPLLIRYPREIKAGSVCDDMALNLDFAPTFLELAGLTPPGEMQGRSLRSVFQGRTPSDWRTSMYYNYYEYPDPDHWVRPHYGVRTRRYKLIHFHGGMDAWELYDLERDPHELNNVYADAAHADTVRTLKEELRRLQDQYRDSPELTQQLIEQSLKGRGAGR